MSESKTNPFYPTLSAGLTARDVDPESDGVFIQGEVKARDSYRQSMRSCRLFLSHTGI